MPDRRGVFIPDVQPRRLIDAFSDVPVEPNRRISGRGLGPTRPHLPDLRGTFRPYIWRDPARLAR